MNHYFPPDSVNWEYFEDSNSQTFCPWKGKASYYYVKENGSVNKDAAWYYPDPSHSAKPIKDYIAFWVAGIVVGWLAVVGYRLRDLRADRAGGAVSDAGAV